MTVIDTLGKQAKDASKELLRVSSQKKNFFLNELAILLESQSNSILEANNKDMEQGKEHGISDIMLDRLLLTEDRIKGMSQGLQQVADLVDPIGQVIKGYTNTDGLKIVQKRVPLGVIAMIFESRPNVTIDAFSLAFKTNNAIILRGGRDALNSNKALVSLVKEALKAAELSEHAIQLLEDPSHDLAEELMKATDYIDVLIPRGGARLIQTVKEKAKVPVIETGVGNVHIYIDQSADLEMAIQIVINAKTQRPSVCNTAEGLVIHEAIAEKFIAQLEAEIVKVHPVEFRVEEKALSLFKNAVLANEEDYASEFLDYIMSVKIVSSLGEAIDWINRYSSHHSEAIITKDLESAEQFQEFVDAAVVYVNASTRFTDGFVFGLGAEIGISTQKIHARGPMGLEALTSSKYYINGNGQVRQ